MARRPKPKRLAARGDVEGLIRAVRFRDETIDAGGMPVDMGAQVRLEAVTELSTLGGPRALVGLGAAMSDPDHHVRAAAITALGRRAQSDHDAADVLVVTVVRRPPAALQDREQVARALVNSRQERLAERLVDEVLALPEGTEIPDVGGLLLLLVDRAPEADTDHLVVRLIETLRRPGTLEGRRAETLLGWLRSRAVPALMDAVRPPAAPRPGLISALGRTRDSRVTPLLTSLLTQKDSALRRAAVDALGLVRDPRSIEALLYASADEDYETRTAAIRAITAFGPLSVAVAINAGARAGGHLPGAAGDQIPAGGSTAPAHVAEGLYPGNPDFGEPAEGFSDPER